MLNIDDAETQFLHWLLLRLCHVTLSKVR